MKRVLAVFAAACLICSTFVSRGVAVESPTLALSDISGRGGQGANLSVSVANFASVTDPGGTGVMDGRLSAIQIKIQYDSSVLELNYNETSDPNPCVLPNTGGIKWETDLAARNNARLGDYIYFFTADFSGRGLAGIDDAVVANIPVKIKADAPAGTYGLTLEIAAIVTGLEGYPKQISDQFIAVNSHVTVQPTQADQKPALSLSDLSGKAGDSAALTLSVKNFASAVDPGGAGTMDKRFGLVRVYIQYDPMVLELDYDEKTSPNPCILSTAGGLSWNTDLATKHNDQIGDYIYFLTCELGAKGLAGLDDADIAKIPLKIKANAAEGTYPITLIVDSVTSGVEGTPKEIGDQFGAVSAKLTVQSPVLSGDLNQDIKVDAADVVALRALIASGTPPTAGQLAAADLNGDGKLTSDDTALLLALLNIVPGDVSKDGKLNALDIMSIRKIMLSGNPDLDQLAAGDLDGNGSFTALDIMKLRKLMLEAV